MSDDPAWQPSWRNRRRTIFGTLGFCALTVGYIVVKDSGSSLHEEVAQALIMLAGFVIGSYVFGAVWDSRNVMDSQRR